MLQTSVNFVDLLCTVHWHCWSGRGQVMATMVKPTWPRPAPAEIALLKMALCINQTFSDVEFAGQRRDSDKTGHTGGVWRATLYAPT